MLGIHEQAEGSKEILAVEEPSKGTSGRAKYTPSKRTQDEEQSGQRDQNNIAEGINRLVKPKIVQRVEDFRRAT